jgi:preprotein translocase subunit YajC
VSPTGLLFLVVIFGLAWLLLIRPQRRRQEQTDKMLRALRVDDEVVTAGGIYGRITALDEDDVHVEIAPELTVRVARRAIAGVVNAEPEPEEAVADEEEEPEPTPSEHG